MMKPEFARFVAKLCTHFDHAEPKPERMDSTFEDVKHIPGSALDDISRHIRTAQEREFFPKNLSDAMLKAFAAVKHPQRASCEQPEFTPPTPEQLEANRKRTEYWAPRIIRLTSSMESPCRRDERIKPRRAV